MTDFKWCIDPVNDTNDETILAAVKAKNPNLDTSQVYVKQKVVNGRLELGVKSTSNKYNTTSSGHCDNFTVRQNISNIITNTQLGSLNNNNKDTILNAVKTKNPNLDTSQVGVSRITDTSADIDGATYYNSNKYQGYKTVYFTNKKCSFKEIFLTPVWDNWYRLIPGYDAYHAIECI
ncbi:hypothetical protein [Spiroplasma endosymbiont of Tipula paludosa]|uniref:hypothetical protein n=1 Tax=Spiroplasma endosymbiont of Tipula paludosa TaxID=3066295 RepID=UPI0035C8CA8A